MPAMNARALPPSLHAVNESLAFVVELAVPGVNGLTASFDYQFTGTRAGNDTNSLWVAGYNLLDVGMRYNSRHLTWRLAVDNLTDRHYWSTVAPSNLTGANTGSLIGHLGSPRTLLASVTLRLGTQR